MNPSSGMGLPRSRRFPGFLTRPDDQRLTGGLLGPTPARPTPYLTGRGSESNTKVDPFPHLLQVPS